MIAEVMTPGWGVDWSRYLIDEHVTLTAPHTQHAVHSLHQLQTRDLSSWPALQSLQRVLPPAVPEHTATAGAQSQELSRAGHWPDVLTSTMPAQVRYPGGDLLQWWPLSVLSAHHSGLVISKIKIKEIKCVILLEQ